MTSERLLINKNYYKAFLEGNEKEEPIKVVGELFHSEQQKVVTDLSSLRFAQGELYYHNKDYETAVFKWENVHNELKSWARKNIGDAHVELELYEMAVENYQAVKTDSTDLKIEVLLQLFSVYKQRGKYEMAANSIKNAVELNPDYSDVTEIARVFFENQSDHSNAVELAMSEAVRTDSLVWFEVLESYMVKGYTVEMAPATFREVLMSLYSLDQSRFESLLVALWQSYEQHDISLLWLKEINHLLLDISPNPSYRWRNLTKLYEETYSKLMNGSMLIEDLTAFIPNHLTNWMNISIGPDTLTASTAVLTWHELYPAWLDETIVSEAEKLQSSFSHEEPEFENIMRIFDLIRNWAKSNELSLNEREEWMINELLDSTHFHLMIAGTETEGKSKLVNHLLGEEVANKLPLATSQFKYAEQLEIKVITDKGVRILEESLELDEMIENDYQAVQNVEMPSSFLNRNNLALIDTMAVNPKESRNTLFSYMHLADGLLFVMDASTHLTYQEVEVVIKIREQSPELPINFVLSDTQQDTNTKTLEEITSWIQTYFPNSSVYIYHPFSKNDNKIETIMQFISSMVQEYNPENEVKRKVLHFSKQLIKLLFDKRIEMENKMVETVKWHDEMAVKLDAAINQLHDLQEEKMQVMKSNYHIIMNEMRQDLLASIPDLLVQCAKLVQEDSNFDNIHVLLNDEMNKRIHSYINDKALPSLTIAIQEWIATSEVEFKDSQEYLDEMAEGISQLANESMINLNCDFRVLDDWRRDLARMTSGSIQLEYNNILKSSASSQFIMKNADKLFGAIVKNKGMLKSKYKQFIQSKDYSKTAEFITDGFMQPFEFFGKTLERDIHMFFAKPYTELNKAVEDNQHAMESNEQSLSKMRENPEVYTDPLKLFELQIRQYEWMKLAEEDNMTIVK